MSSTWNLIRSLIDPTQTKTETSHKLRKLLETFEHTDDLFNELITTHIADPVQPQYADYKSAEPENEGLTGPITLAELQRALAEAKPNKAPGPDQITTTQLRNLTEADHAFLLQQINNVWDTGSLPEEWKTASIIFIPKPGKPQAIANLRPISLTSCVGKLMERIVLNRLLIHLEQSQHLPHNLIGYRHHLSTQDVLLQLHEEITKETSSAQLKAILAIDLKKAFDYVNHDAMLQELEATGCGTKLYNYIRDFLRSRTYTLRVGDITSQQYPHPQRGIPQVP